MKGVVLKPPPVDYLGHIKPEDEAQRNEANATLTVNTNPFKIQFSCFIFAENKSVDNTDSPVQHNIDQETSPYRLENPSFPYGEQSCESAKLASCVHMLDVGDCHPQPM